MAKKFTDEDFKEEDFTENELDRYSDNYSEEGFIDKATKNAKTAGKGLIYNAFKLYYVTENPNVPAKVKAGIFGALGYFVLPFDLVADFIPMVGYTDDIAAIGAALVMAQMYIDDNVKFKAKKKIADLLGEKFARDLN